jgi:hypothetical protein
MRVKGNIQADTLSVNQVGADLNLGGKDVLNAAAGIFRDKMRAEAFYLEAGGEFSRVGSAAQLKASSLQLNTGALTATVTGDATLSIADTLLLDAQNQLNLQCVGTINLTADDDVNITSDGGSVQIASDGPIDFHNSKVRFFPDGAINVADKVTAEAFYLKTGGELITGIDVRDSDTIYLNNPALVFNPADFYLTKSSRGEPVINMVAATQPTQVYVHPTSMTTTSSVFADVVGFVFQVKAGGYYTFEYRVILNSNAATEGPGLQLVTPTFSVFQALIETAAAVTPGTATIAAGHQLVSGTGVQFATGTTSPRLGRISGIIAPTADGTVQLQLATEIGGANFTTLSAGSCVFVSRLL